MNEMQLVQNWYPQSGNVGTSGIRTLLTGNATQELSCEGLDMMAWERGEVILLQEIVHTHAQKLRDYAYVVFVVEPV